MQFEVTILGSNAAIPAHGRHPSAHILTHNGHSYLIDCGEGTQFQMIEFSIKRAKLDNIFITHLHGDHFFGLIGLLTSFNLNWREHPLDIYGPEGLEEIIKIHFKYAKTELKYPLTFHVVDNQQAQTIFENEVLSVESIPLKHRIPTTGYLFKEKPHPKKIRSEKIAEYSIPYKVINLIKEGADFIMENGKVIPNDELTLPAPPSRSYAYCSDTLFIKDFVSQVQGVSMLYHEATFGEEHAFRAEETFHSTAKQAAEVARASGAGKLLIGHFSARYEDATVLLNEAREVFPESFLAVEGQTFEIE